jgi:hypothetical protein
MKLKAGQLETADLLMGELMKVKLPVATSYKIARFIKNQFTRELTTFLEKRQEIAKEYCKRDENSQPVLLNGNVYQFEPENEVKANQEVMELLNQEITFEFEPLTVELLGKIDIAPAVLMGLEDLGFIKGGDSQ